MKLSDLPDGPVQDILFEFLDIVELTKLRAAGWRDYLSPEIRAARKGAVVIHSRKSLIVPSIVMENLFQRSYFLDKLKLHAGDYSMDFSRFEVLKVQASRLKSLGIPCEGTFQERTLLTFAENLQQLHCSNLFMRNINCLKQVACTRITHLSFARCYELANFNPKTMRQFKNLTNLNLSFCYQLQDPELCRILRQAHNLLILDISHCELITGVSMDAVVDYLPRIRKIDITGCFNISIRVIGRVMDRCKHVQIAEYTIAEAVAANESESLTHIPQVVAKVPTNEWIVALFYSIEYYLVINVVGLVIWALIEAAATLWLHYYVGLSECLTTGWCQVVYFVYFQGLFLMIFVSIYDRVRVELQSRVAYRMGAFALLTALWMGSMCFFPWLVALVEEEQRSMMNAGPPPEERVYAKIVRIQ